jgi:hypothetical protein
MSVGFFSLPGEIRIKIYEELLVDPNTITIFPKYNSTWHEYNSAATAALGVGAYTSTGYLQLHPAILRMNRLAYDEARSILYSKNCFEIEEPKTLASFLGQIGSQNAGLLRHLVIAFPDFYNDGHAVGITMRDDGMEMFNLIRDKCQNIAILETSLSTTNARETRFDDFNSPRAVDQALALVHARLQAIPSLPEVIVQVFDIPVNVAVREKMRDYGWVIKIIGPRREIVDISDDSDDYDDYDSGFGYYGGLDTYEDYDHYETERSDREWWEDYDRRNNSD